MLNDCIKYVGSFSYINQIIIKISHYKIYLMMLSQKLKTVGRTIILSSDYLFGISLLYRRILNTLKGG